VKSEQTDKNAVSTHNIQALPLQVCVHVFVCVCVYVSVCVFVCVSVCVFVSVCMYVLNKSLWTGE
jgi:hypothetical protein